MVLVIDKIFHNFIILNRKFDIDGLKRMYNIKGPSKIVAKTTTRRGVPQKIDNYRDHSKSKVTEGEPIESSSTPKPVFQKKSSPTNQRLKSISRQHEDIINFIYDSWNSVCTELESENGDSDESGCGSVQTICYYEDEPCELQNFKPFDLESWWGKRLYAYITSSEYKS